jgi:hypothetical protein
MLSLNGALTYLELATGKNYYTNFLGSYDHPRNCRQMIKEALPLFRSDLDMVEQIFCYIMKKECMEEIGPQYMTQGDICLIKNNGRTAACICLGNKVAAIQEQGLLYLSREDAYKAWRVK